MTVLLLLHPVPPPPRRDPLSHCTAQPRRPRPFDWQQSDDPFLLDTKDRP